MKIIMILAMIVCSFSLSAHDNSSHQIRTVMAMQQDAWNQGDIKQYMQGYWQSEQLKFVGKEGITYGWQKTLDGYLKRYPDTKTMGQLSFDILQVSVSGDTAFVLGKWSLAREKDNPKGYYSLYWKKINDQWRIIIDHTS